MAEGAPIVVTERLELWQPRGSDMAEVIAMVSDPETGRFLGPESRAADHFTRFQRNAGSWFLHGYGNFTVRKRGHSEIVGNCGIFHSWRGLGEDFDDMPEVGWIIAAEHSGKGYASEAMAAAVDWFEREHGKQRIVCMIDPDNATSIHLAGKLGFTVMRDAEMGDGEIVTLFELVI